MIIGIVVLFSLVIGGWMLRPTYTYYELNYHNPAHYGYELDTAEWDQTLYDRLPGDPELSSEEWIKRYLRRGP